MKQFYVVVVLLLAALGSNAQNSKQNEDAKLILTLEAAWNRAEKNGDRAALDLLVGDEFVYTDSDGSFRNRAQWLADVKRNASQYELLADQDEAVHLYGNVAVVTGEYREKDRVNGKMVLRRGRFTDTWVKQNGQWKCVATQATLISG